MRKLRGKVSCAFSMDPPGRRRMGCCRLGGMERKDEKRSEMSHWASQPPWQLHDNLLVYICNASPIPCRSVTLSAHHNYALYYFPSFPCQCVLASPTAVWEGGSNITTLLPKDGYVLVENNIRRVETSALLKRTEVALRSWRKSLLLIWFNREQQLRMKCHRFRGKLAYNRHSGDNNKKNRVVLVIISISLKCDTEDTRRILPRCLRSTWQMDVVCSLVRGKHFSKIRI